MKDRTPEKAVPAPVVSAAKMRPVRVLLIASAPLALVALVGCVAQYGSDFGHWSGVQERVPLFRIERNSKVPAPTAGQLVAILPTIGPIPAKERRAMDEVSLPVARQVLAAQTVAMDPKGAMSSYLANENLLSEAGGLNQTEAALVGRLVDAAYVLAVHVQSVESFPPQHIVMTLTMLDTAAGSTVASVSVCMRAQDQRTQEELGEYLKVRVARKYDRSSLDVILRSPSEFQSFAMTRGLQVLNATLWPPPPEDPSVEARRRATARR